jgi:hypothetical protein
MPMASYSFGEILHATNENANNPTAAIAQRTVAVFEIGRATIQIPNY